MNNMNLITKGVLRFSVFVVIKSLVDVYLIEQPMNHYINFGVGIIFGVGLTYWDYRSRENEGVYE